MAVVDLVEPPVTVVALFRCGRPYARDVGPKVWRESERSGLIMYASLNALCWV